MESRLSRYILFVVSVFAIAIVVDHFQDKWFNNQFTQWAVETIEWFESNSKVDREPVPSTHKVVNDTDDLNQLEASPFELLKQKVIPQTPNSDTHNQEKTHYFEQHSNVCSTAELTAQQKQRRKQALKEDLVFSWVDDNGITHFSNTLFGAGDDAQILEEYQSQLEPLELSVSSSKALPRHFENKVTVGIKKIYQILSLYLDKQHLLEVEVNLTFAHSKREYQSIQRAKAPNLGQSQGFYTSNGNYAAVWFKNSKQAQKTAVHEATHVINSGLFGNTPKWLNEGLAEYFERMKVIGLAAKIQPQDWSTLNQVKRMRLISLINSTRQDWKGSNQSTMYSASNSLVHFLMSTPRGKPVAKQLLSHLAVNRCGKTNVQDVLSLYPNGLNGLERDWHHWMKNVKYKVQSL
ncbi:MAG: peptidase MA family metallohydrolase [Parashewanella sp.]